MPTPLSLWKRLANWRLAERGAALWRRLLAKTRGRQFRQRCKLIAFPLSLGLACCLTQQVLRAGLRRSLTGTVGLCNRVVSGKINAEVLILGSSRAFVHFDPAIIERHTGKSAFNLACDGTRPDFQLAFLQTYLRHNRRPEYLALAVDVTSFQGAGGIPNSGLYVAFLDQPEIFAALRREGKRWLLARYFPLIAIAQDRGIATFYGLKRERAAIEAVRGLLGWHRPEFLREGYLPVDLEWREDFEQFKKQNPNGARVQIGSTGIANMRKILELCGRLQIRVILVYPPEYQESQAFCVNRREVFQKFESLAREFQVPFWDYSAHPLCADRTFFYNSQHLNVRGATRFSEDFARRLEDVVRQPGQAWPPP